ncbi:MAG: DUF4910 domain-containing protein [Promethearchaeota archaeon]
MPINLDFDQDAAYKTIEDLCKIGPRVSGSDAETRAVLLIEERFRSAGLATIQILGHEHSFYEAETATLGLPDDSIVIQGVPCWMSASTILGGVESETVYIGSYQMIDSLKREDVENKLVITLYVDRPGETTESWKKLYAMNPDGVVFLDLERDAAPRDFLNSELIPSFSRIPSIVVSASQTRILHENMFGSQMKMVVKGSRQSGNIQSIECKLKGKSPQTVLVCAHHDTHPLSQGATDNAAGVAIMLELARILAQQELNLSYQFVSFGGEEFGMKGSRSYASQVDLDNIALCINFDSIGELPGMLLAFASGTDEMIDWVSKISVENKYPAHCRRASTTGGDNKVFAANGIPTIHLASYGTTTGKVSHSAIDDVSLLTPFTIGELGKFACSIIKNLEISKKIPFMREVPDDLLQAAKQRLVATGS